MLSPSRAAQLRAYLEARRSADPAHPLIERDRVEGALEEHLRMLGLPRLRLVRWQRDGAPV